MTQPQMKPLPMHEPHANGPDLKPLHARRPHRNQPHPSPLHARLPDDKELPGQAICAGRHCGGFSLVEVLVALVIIAVGMLGIAKMQALALSSTGSAGTRSLVSLEAAGLAASMHADRDYWSGTLLAATTNVNVAGGAATIDVSQLNTAQSCTAACTPTQLAAFDLQNFGAALAQIVPEANANITCQILSVPQSCTITITWLENIVGMSSAASGTVISSTGVGPAPTTNLIQQPAYTLYVEP